MSYSVIYQDIGLKGYKEAWDYQERIFRNLVEDKLHRPGATISYPGTLIFVEHYNVFTLGKSGSENNLLTDRIQLQAKNVHFFRTDRGGDITYHGPGQIVGYPIFDLERMKISLREYIYRLEETIIRTIAVFGLSGARLTGATGVWLDPGIPGRARKICAIGVKASHYITMHGFAFNVNTDLTYFNYINPCGLTGKGVTSLEKELGQKQDFEKVKQLVRDNLKQVFNLTWTN
ncbi:MAG: lipoyl(octanoyl) transferase LipB [Bacteroidota bacterium]|nr:lipoyl(octanoyl) transferase LipB [Bacteroidota bacterium]